MSLVKWAIFGLLMLPFVEIAVFVAVALKLGVLAALALTILTSLAGMAIVRNAGHILEPEELLLAIVALLAVAVPDAKVAVPVNVTRAVEQLLGAGSVVRTKLAMAVSASRSAE